ncbi:MAG: methyltransferase domain-containing protein [Polynucleobacter sp.]|nr:methyltransferase domain-containing protein [Polynucleobacter sp.]
MRGWNFTRVLRWNFDTVELDWSKPAVQNSKTVSPTRVHVRCPVHPFEENSFDVGTFTKAPDHVPVPKECLSDTHQISPKGLLMVTRPKN